MKKFIILNENDLDTLTSGGELTIVGEDKTEVHVTTEAAYNRRKTIEELCDILIHCGAVSASQGVQKIDITDLPWGGYLCHDAPTMVTVNFNKLAEAACDYFDGK